MHWKIDYCAMSSFWYYTVLHCVTKGLIIITTTADYLFRADTLYYADTNEFLKGLPLIQVSGYIACHHEEIIIFTSYETIFSGNSYCISFLFTVCYKTNAFSHFFAFQCMWSREYTYNFCIVRVLVVYQLCVSWCTGQYGGEGWNSIHVTQSRFHSNIAPSVWLQNKLVSSILKLVNNNSSSLNKGNHDCDGVWIYLILISITQLVN